jgi:hypothetical protein
MVRRVGPGARRLLRRDRVDRVPIYPAYPAWLETCVADAARAEALVEGKYWKTIQGDPSTDELVSGIQGLWRDGGDIAFLPPIPLIRMPMPSFSHSMRSNSHGRILFKLLGALAALVFIAYGFNDRAEITSIQRSGKLATVKPIENYTEFKQSAFSTYTAEFHFTTQDGRNIVQRHSFPEEALSDFKAGRPVQIVYLPNDPSTFVFASEKPGWWLIIAGFALLLTALFFA